MLLLWALSFRHSCHSSATANSACANLFNASVASYRPFWERQKIQKSIKTLERFLVNLTASCTRSLSAASRVVFSEICTMQIFVKTLTGKTITLVRRLTTRAIKFCAPGLQLPDLLTPSILAPSALTIQQVGLKSGVFIPGAATALGKALKVKFIAGGRVL